MANEAVNFNTILLSAETYNDMNNVIMDDRKTGNVPSKLVTLSETTTIHDYFDTSKAVIFDWADIGNTQVRIRISGDIYQ